MSELSRALEIVLPDLATSVGKRGRPQAQLWAEEQSMWARYDARQSRRAKVEARKARAAEYRKTKPQRQYRDL